MPKPIASVWNGGMSPVAVASTASDAHRTIAAKPASVAARRDGIDPPASARFSQRPATMK